MTEDYERFKTATKTAINRALHNGSSTKELAKLIEIKFVSFNEDIETLKNDYEFHLFLKSKNINVRRPVLIKGKCRCCTLITRVIFPDEEFYFYTKDYYDGFKIFRCKNCKKIINNRWSEK